MKAAHMPTAEMVDDNVARVVFPLATFHVNTNNENEPYETIAWWLGVLARKETNERPKQTKRVRNGSVRKEAVA
jgi:hypothetical protein